MTSGSKLTTRPQAEMHPGTTSCLIQSDSSGQTRQPHRQPDHDKDLLQQEQEQPST
jgi:hypothetical protein